MRVVDMLRCFQYSSAGAVAYRTLIDDATLGSGTASEDEVGGDAGSDNASGGGNAVKVSDAAACVKNSSFSSKRTSPAFGSTIKIDQAGVGRRNGGGGESFASPSLTLAITVTDHDDDGACSTDVPTFDGSSRVGGCGEGGCAPSWPATQGTPASGAPNANSPSSASARLADGAPCRLPDAMPTAPTASHLALTPCGAGSLSASSPIVTAATAAGIFPPPPPRPASSPAAPSAGAMVASGDDGSVARLPTQASQVTASSAGVASGGSGGATGPTGVSGPMGFVARHLVSHLLCPPPTVIGPSILLGHRSSSSSSPLDAGGTAVSAAASAGAGVPATQRTPQTGVVHSAPGSTQAVVVTPELKRPPNHKYVKHLEAASLLKNSLSDSQLHQRRRREEERYIRVPVGGRLSGASAANNTTATAPPPIAAPPPPITAPPPPPSSSPLPVITATAAAGVKASIGEGLLSVRNQCVKLPCSAAAGGQFQGPPAGVAPVAPPRPATACPARLVSGVRHCAQPAAEKHSQKAQLGNQQPQGVHGRLPTSAGAGHCDNRCSVLPALRAHVTAHCSHSQQHQPPHQHLRQWRLPADQIDHQRTGLAAISRTGGDKAGVAGQQAVGAVVLERAIEQHELPRREPCLLASGATAVVAAAVAASAAAAAATGPKAPAAAVASRSDAVSTACNSNTGSGSRASVSSASCCRSLTRDVPAATVAGTVSVTSQNGGTLSSSTMTGSHRSPCPPPLPQLASSDCLRVRPQVSASGVGCRPTRCVLASCNSSSRTMAPTNAAAPASTAAGHHQQQHRTAAATAAAGGTHGLASQNHQLHQQLHQQQQHQQQQQRTWLHKDSDILKQGICYTVKYVGCLEVLTSMKSLDFETRTLIAKECTVRVCEAAGLRAIDRKRKTDRRLQRLLADKPNMQHAGANVSLRINSSSLTLTDLETNQTVTSHAMPNISFASGGEQDTLDFVAYVGKDDQQSRACFVLECGGGLAQEVIATIGQAFELRFREFMRRSPVLVVPTLAPPRDPDYYNDLPGKMPPPEPTKMPNKSAANNNSATATTPNNNLAACGAGSENLIDLENAETPVNPSSVPPIHDYVNTNLDPFDMMPMSELLPPSSGLVAATTAQASSGAPALSDNLTNESGASTGLLPPPEVVAAIEQQLLLEPWYHGAISRTESEALLERDGDFLVRESQGQRGQFVLTGLQAGQGRHLLLIDPNGVVRTKERTFSSVSHLINFHRDNQLPILSVDSALLLVRPIANSCHSGSHKPCLNPTGHQASAGTATTH